MIPKRATPINAKQLLEQQNTPESRFVLRAMAITASRGGTPKASYENGQFVFTYPDGTRTIGGRVQS